MFKYLRVMITAFSLRPIKQFCREIAISLPKTGFGDQSFSFTDISHLVLQTVWPLLKGSKEYSAGNRLQPLKTISVKIMNWHNEGF